MASLLEHLIKLFPDIARKYASGVFRRAALDSKWFIPTQNSREPQGQQEFPFLEKIN